MDSSTDAIITPVATQVWRAAHRWLLVVVRGNAGRAGVALVGLALMLALLGPFLAPYSPTQIGLSVPGSGPSWAHLLGSDQLGRDVLSRLLTGGRSLVGISLLVTTVAFALGAVIGVVSGYSGGWLDSLTTRVIDTGLSLPPLLLIMLFVMSLGSSTAVLVCVVALFFAPRVARIIRGATQSVCAEDYVLAAKARGESAATIVFLEIVPNISGPILAEFAMRFTYAIIFISTLNYLGLGVQPPSSDWGLMISEGNALVTQAPLAVVAPALAIVSLAVGANLISSELSTHFSRAGAIRAFSV